jgi:hypothetical protein
VRGHKLNPLKIQMKISKISISSYNFHVKPFHCSILINCSSGGTPQVHDVTEYTREVQQRQLDIISMIKVVGLPFLGEGRHGIAE